jgi:hypothetical protein
MDDPEGTCGSLQRKRFIEIMTTAAALDPSQRQILVNLGNRYVVFGPSSGRPALVRFSPEDTSEFLPPIADEDEGEVTEARIAQTLQVSGLEGLAAVEKSQNADVEILDDQGSRVLIDLKVREHDPRRRDYEQADERLRRAARNGQALETWFFNLERLKLTIMRFNGSGLQVDELTPLDVWEKTTEGLLRRAEVIEEVADWICRVEALYESVQNWLVDRNDLKCERNRTVLMSEEMMQKFAVPEREIPVLDVVEADNQVVASFVPRGLWMIGSWGRVDVITRDQTHMLHALGGIGKLEWRLTAPHRQNMVPFNKGELLALLAYP